MHECCNDVISRTINACELFISSVLCMLNHNFYETLYWP